MIARNRGVVAYLRSERPWATLTSAFRPAAALDRLRGRRPAAPTRSSQGAGPPASGRAVRRWKAPGRPRRRGGRACSAPNRGSGQADCRSLRRYAPMISMPPAPSPHGSYPNDLEAVRSDAHPARLSRRSTFDASIPSCDVRADFAEDVVAEADPQSRASGRRPRRGS